MRALVDKEHSDRQWGEANDEEKIKQAMKPFFNLCVNLRPIWWQRIGEDSRVLKSLLFKVTLLIQDGVTKEHYMKASVLGCPSRLLVASFPMMNIMETDGHERYRQPISLPSPHVVDVKCQPTHGYVIYLFFFHISCPLLHNLVDFGLTDLWSLIKLLFWA